MHTLRTSRRMSYAVVALLAVLLTAVPAAPERAEAAASHAAAERQFLELINGARRARDRAALVASPGAAKVARRWSRRMAETGDLRHNPKVGDQLPMRWRGWGENVGWASNHAGAPLRAVVRRLHERFMASDGHRANVLGDYNQVGIGVAVDRDGTVWATMVFVHGPRPRTKKPQGLTDIAGNTHRAAITRAVKRDLLEPCAKRRFCPNRAARRIEVARAVARMRGLAPSRGDHFDDVGSGRNVVNTLADAGVIEGCAKRRFCPAAPVTRAQAASLLVRALPGLEPLDGRRFRDLPGGYVHTPAINALAAEGITRGCAPRRFCPARRMTRGQLASLLVRALDR